MRIPSRILVTELEKLDACEAHLKAAGDLAREAGAPALAGRISIARRIAAGIAKHNMAGPGQPSDAKQQEGN